MSTSDPKLPFELHGALGQVIDAGGGFVPLLAPAPLPGAMASSTPGISPGAASAPIAPTLPATDDPAAMVRVLAQLAGEMFGAPSLNGLAPVAPESAEPPTPHASSRLPTSAAQPSGPAPARPAPVAPVSGTMPTAAPSAPGSPGMDVLTQPPAGVPSLPASPFLPSTFDGMPPADVLRFPMFDVPAIDAPPSYEPAVDALGLETRAPDFEIPDVTAHEVRPERESLVRDLGGTGFDPHAVKKDFPILEERIHGRRLVWLDNAATTQKPRAVIDRLSYYYEHENSNIHRAAHTLAARATDAYEKARDITRRFLNAPSVEEIIFVRGATEGINLVAQSWGRRNVAAGDEIVVTHLEHHANIVPWQMLCAEKGVRLRVAPVDDRGDVILDEYEKLLGPKTRLVAFTQVSNALGTVTPAREMIEMAHRHGAKVLLDGAQAVSHMPVDVQALDCDFYSFSGHKVFAPTGIGVVFGKREILAAMPPWQGGGNMIQDVTFEKTVYQAPPWRFEAGTGNIADAVGLGEALDYVMRIGMATIERYEHELLVYADQRLATVPGLHMIGNPRHKAGVLSFVLDGQRTEEVGGALDKEGIAVRSGHHCAQPILRRFGVEATVRASLAFYNVCEDIDALVDALRRLQLGRPAA